MTSPELSVVLTSHNRRELLRICLDSLARQTAPVEDFEVVVVLDGSADGSEEMLAGLEMPFRLTVHAQQQSGQSAARNAGVARAEGRFLLFIDDDEEASPELVATHLAAHRARDRIAGVGPIMRRVPENADRLARMQSEGYDAHHARLVTSGVTYLEAYGGNLSVRRSAFDEVGGFATDLPRETDFEFAYRLHIAGIEFVYLLDAVVTEYRTRHWKLILVDLELRGRLAVELYRRHPAMVTKMELGGYGSWSRSWVALRMLALKLRLTPRLLARAGFVLPRRQARRWFWFVLTCAYWRGVRDAIDPELWPRVVRGTPILRYHAFTAPGESRSRYVVGARRFERQLAWLARRGYGVLSLDEYAEHRQNNLFPPAKSVVITIDDGYTDNDTVARPLLERFGFPATVFLITQDGRDGRDDPALARRPLMTLEHARSLGAGLLAFGAHTRTHRDLTTLDPAEAEAEVAGSKQDLEEALGRPVTAFAYPFGEATPEVRRMVERAGFRSAVGVRPGHNYLATDPFELRRIEVRGTDGLLRFAAMLVVGELRSRKAWR